MRIAVLYWNRRKVGGTEVYLESIIEELFNAGHEIAFCHEVDKPKRNERINLPEGVAAWSVADEGVESALAALRRWAPDVIYSHGLMSPKLEGATLKIAPAVFFAHAYYGTCISGHKTLRAPAPATPCNRRFGWQCLVQYYPHRCGGLSPISMVREYRRQSNRLKQLQNYRAIVTHSTHMRDEYIKHGFSPDRVHSLSYYAHQQTKPFGPDEGLASLGNTAPLTKFTASAEQANGNGKTPAQWRLLFLGRMDRLKGGNVLIDALAQVRKTLDRPLRVTFAGEGRMRKLWQRRAARVQERNDGIEIGFTGWVKDYERELLWKDCDLLVVPSVWPEPFGLVGTEAGLRGVPIAGFAVGGITDWLSDGVNGHLAPGDPPTAAGLADAIAKCLRDSETHGRLRIGAVAMAREFNVKNHLTLLLGVLETVAGSNQDPHDNEDAD